VGVVFTQALLWSHRRTTQKAHRKRFVGNDIRRVATTQHNDIKKPSFGACSPSPHPLQMPTQSLPAWRDHRLAHVRPRWRTV